ncbi:MAG: multicopper oxidase domain-containing protein [Alteraurantiacibacter sp.]
MVDFKDTALGEEITFETFGCKVFDADPETPDRLQPDKTIYREGAEKLDLMAPDGKKIRVWTFADTSPGAQLRDEPLTYPAPLMRVTQGQVVHTRLTSSTGPHTIHHHGIEPSTFNDGVGHVSFEVGDSYTYQWQPSRTGTFFYHCHRNTTLHFELGMFGGLIVDPPDEGDGQKRIYTGGPVYDSEKFWVVDDMDPRWHLIGDHDAGLCGMDVGLNRFEPEYFLLSGVFNNRTEEDTRAVVEAQPGERVLIRLLNASYSRLEVRFACDVTIVESDGHMWGKEPWCPNTVLVPAGERIEMVPAQRYGLMLTTQGVGDIPVEMKFRHWITGKVQHDGAGRLNTRIKVR